MEEQKWWRGESQVLRTKGRLTKACLSVAAPAHKAQHKSCSLDAPIVGERETAAGANRQQWHRHALGGRAGISHQPVGSITLVLYRWPHDILTRMISLTATTPEVAIILALFGIRLKIVGIMASAPWSNLFPRTDDRCLQQERTSCSHVLTHREAQRLSTVDSPPSQFS